MMKTEESLALSAMRVMNKLTQSECAAAPVRIGYTGTSSVSQSASQCPNIRISWMYCIIDMKLFALAAALATRTA